MDLYLSFEQEAVVADAANAPKGADRKSLHTGYVAVADGDLYDGPGAKAPPGNVLAWIGPIPEARAGEAVAQTAVLLRRLGHKVKVTGE